MESRWKSVTILAKLIELVGWVVIVIGIVGAFRALNNDFAEGLEKVALMGPGLAVAFAGFLTVCMGQLTQVFIATEENVRAVIEQNKATNAMLGEVLGGYKISLDRLASSVTPVAGSANAQDGGESSLKVQQGG